LVVQLAQRRDVVEDPERAAVRRNNQVVAVNREIAHRGVRQIQLQRLPGISIVEGNIDRCLGAGKKEPLAGGIFTHGVDGSIRGQPGDNLLPVGAEVARAVDVRIQVVEAKSIDGSVGRARVKVRSFQDGYLAPGCELRWRDIFPALSCVASDVN